MDDGRPRLARDELNVFRLRSHFGSTGLTCASRQRHPFNIPFDRARESNSLHSKRMKGSSQQSPFATGEVKYRKSINNEWKEGANNATQGERGMAGRPQER